jgi:histidinol phosphatase-like PHP family hydrolase
MKYPIKVQIYQGMVQYILESTHYTLKNIAQLSHSSLDNIRKIYCCDAAPCDFKSEIELLKLYQIVLEINTERERYSLVG